MCICNKGLVIQPRIMFNFNDFQMPLAAKPILFQTEFY